MNILVTGGTGFLGRTLIANQIKKKNVKRIVIYSRRWDAQEKMKDYYTQYHPELVSKLRFITGCIRDRISLNSAMNGIDLVIHTAAYKHVSWAEYNPREVIGVNIEGSQNVIDCAIKNNVKRVLAISTDKATDAYNLYGKTKSVMESMMVSANNLGDTIFNVARYGNVWNSTGSVVEKWASQIKSGKLNIKITDKSMTRFFIFHDDLIEYMNVCLAEKRRGLIMLPVMRSITVERLAICFLQVNKSLLQQSSKTEIGARAGEKLHESLLSNHEKSSAHMINKKVAAIFPVSTWGVNTPHSNEKLADELLFRSNTTGSIPHSELRERIELLIDGTNV